MNKDSIVFKILTDLSQMGYVYKKIIFGAIEKYCSEENKGDKQYIFNEVNRGLVKIGFSQTGKNSGNGVKNEMSNMRKRI